MELWHPAQYKAIFIHIHKCGGTSVKKCLEGIDKVLICDNYTPDSNKNIEDVVRMSIWRTAFKFAIVRHPYSRVISLHEMIVRDWKPITIDEVIDISLMPSPDPKVRTVERVIKRHTLPMSDSHYALVDGTGEIVVDFIAKLENINADWQVIKNKIGIDKDLPHANVTKNISADSHSVLSNRNKERLAEYYKKDFEIFGYKK